MQQYVGVTADVQIGVLLTGKRGGREVFSGSAGTDGICIAGSNAGFDSFFDVLRNGCFFDDFADGGAGFNDCIPVVWQELIQLCKRLLQCCVMAKDFVIDGRSDAKPAWYLYTWYFA